MTQHQWTPTPRELADLELVTLGVLGESELALDLPTDLSADTLELLDPEGLPLARLHRSGRLEPLAHPEFGPFRRFHRRPDDVRSEHPHAVAVPVTGVLTADDCRTIAAHVHRTGATPLLLAMTGPGSPQGISAPGLVRATLAAAADIPGAVVVAVAAAVRDAAFYRRVALAYADDVLTVDGTGEPAEHVTRVRDQDTPARDRRGLVIFFTGLSGSGKSTLARALHDLLLERGDRTVTSLDGDVVRHHLSKGLGFSREDRETNIARIGWVAAEIARHGGVAICSPIAPFDATRRQVRAMVADAGGGFVLVHVATPLDECERRDRKGLYAKARAGLIPEFTGISSPYENPTDASVQVDTTGRTIQDALGDVLHHLYADSWLKPHTPLVPKG